MGVGEEMCRAGGDRGLNKQNDENILEFFKM